MIELPSSNAMDAADPAGGPGALLPSILTGSGERIARHANALFGTAARLSDLYDEFGVGKQRLDTQWSGRTAEQAGAQLADSLAELHRITGEIEHGAALLTVAGTLVSAAQDAYRQVVAETNPVVAELLAGPVSRPAAVTLAALAGNALAAHFGALQGLLTTIEADAAGLSRDGSGEAGDERGD
jgi:hypothetical protein